MKKDETNPKEWLRLIAAARLRSEGQTQNAIAKRLEITQPEVSRLLDAAQRKNLLSPGPTLLRRNISDEDYDAAEKEYFIKDDLIKVLRPLVPRGLHFDVRVVAGTQDTFAFEAARRVADLILLAKRIGVNWGRTVCEVVKGIVARWDPPDADRPLAIECIPLCGDPLFEINDRQVKFSASYLAAALGETLNSSRALGLPCLSGVPAYISPQRARASGTTLENWERFLQGIPGYQKIFGNGTDSRRGLVHGVDTIITGVGIVVMKGEQPWRETGDFITERLDQDELSKSELNELIYGDIGGLLLAREGLDTLSRKLVEELNAGWMGLRFEHLKNVTKLASQRNAPGIIVVAYGKWKADMIRAMVRQGYVNQLIVDWTLAEELGAKTAARRRSERI